MNNKIILFDWDDTLFSKTKYRRNVMRNLIKLSKVSRQGVYEFEKQYFDSLIRSDDFTIEDFVGNFSHKFGIKIDLRDFCTDNLEIYSKALFPETIEILEKMKNKYILGIYSQGFESLQKIKIKYSGIEHFFDPNLIFINREKTHQDFVKNLPAKATVVDDKKEVIEILKKLRPDLELIWINRNDDETIDQIRTIKKLDDLI